jgi:hypothetical protein
MFNPIYPPRARAALAHGANDGTGVGVTKSDGSAGDDRTHLPGQILRAVHGITIAPDAGLYAVGRQGGISAAVRAEETDGAATRKQKIIWQDVIGSRCSIGISTRGSDQKGTVSSVPRQITRDGESVRRPSARRGYYDLLATYELLAATRREELNKLPRAAGVRVNLADVPQVKRCLNWSVTQQGRTDHRGRGQSVAKGTAIGRKRFFRVYSGGKTHG